MNSATRFERVRQDHARESAEDYAELILDLVEEGRIVRPADLAQKLGVTHVTVLRALDRLLRDGIVTRDTDKGIRLSPVGQRMGEVSRERHRIVVAFLVRLGVPQEIANVDAEGIEHHVSQIVLQKMEAFVQEAVEDRQDAIFPFVSAIGKADSEKTPRKAKALKRERP